MKKWVIITLILVFIALVVYGIWWGNKNNLEETTTTTLLGSNVSEGNVTEETTTTTTLANLSNASDEKKITGEVVKELSEHEKCLNKFVALKKEAVIFRYAPWNSFSDEWKPTVNKIEELNYSIVRAQVGNETKGSFYENEDYMKECFEGIYRERTVPQFICAGTKDQFIGINADVYTLRDFAETCRQKAGKTDPERTAPQEV